MAGMEFLRRRHGSRKPLLWHSLMRAQAPMSAIGLKRGVHCERMLRIGTEPDELTLIQILAKRVTGLAGGPGRPAGTRDTLPQTDSGQSRMAQPQLAPPVLRNLAVELLGAAKAR
jgi:hypothetical protein